MNYKVISLFVILLIFQLIAIPSSGEDKSDGWMPEWEVGDWWVVKQSTNVANFPYDSIPQWHDTGTYRFEVLGQEEVNGQLCYAVERKRLPSPLVSGGSRYIYYFHKDNLRPVRRDKYEYRTREFSLQKSKPPSTSDFQYSKNKEDYDRPVFSSGFSLPAFPLEERGKRAGTLSKPGRSTTSLSLGRRYLSQNVSMQKIEEFSKELSESKIEISMKENCYFVLIESWRPKRRVEQKQIMEFEEVDNFTRQLWWTSSPWSLFHEYGMVVLKDYGSQVEGGAKKGARIPMRREWLIDWSSRYKIIEN
ncbi:hypothetical protein IIA15_07360 [candidate division TA06 bacterium]|nr:hypothetical protein [candidate division TA06 bacterium]